MLKHAALLLTLFILGSCAFLSDVIQGDCVRGICGCPRNSTKTVEIKLLGRNSEPIPDAALICLDTGEELGITNSMGLTSIRVPGFTTFCGFYADCEVAVFRTKYSHYSNRPFWFARFIRGESLGSTESKVELIEDGQ
jgi:hypothetical protein